MDRKPNGFPWCKLFSGIFLTSLGKNLPMATPDRPLTLSNHLSTATLISLIIPGSAQFLYGRRWRGAVILLMTVVSAFLVNWALVNAKIGQITLGSLTTSWLWIPFLAFWVWNVLDARQITVGNIANALPGIVFAAIILYVIAWNVTDVRLDRLVTRFNDAKAVASQLINPVLATQTVDGEDKACSFPCLYSYVGDLIAGHTPQNAVHMSDDLLDIFGRVTKVKVPSWEVNLGLASKGQMVTGFVASESSIITTIAMGLLATLFSTLLAIPISFLAAHNIMSRFRGGQVIYTVTRTLLNIVRAVDPVVWGLIVVVWVGLGPFAGVIALTIHSVAALGKLFSEEIEHIDEGPVEALTATGANLIQTIRYGVIPQITPSFLAYSLLRWDINMRSSTVIGFVAGGGIGFIVVETIRANAFQLYATTLWAVAVVIILVDLVSAKWRESILIDQPARNAPASPLWKQIRTAIYVILGLAVFIYCWNQTEINLKDIFHPGNNFLQLVSDFLHFDLSKDVVEVVVQQLLVTVFQALLATTLGAIVALPFSFLAAKNLTGRSRLLAWIYYLTRSFDNIIRSIEALLYVAIFIAWVGIGPFAGMLALAITTFALITKLFSEAIENIDPGPIEALTATGANRLQVIYYAIVPQVVPPFVSYLIYQWDINIRMATIIGFAGGGGIGLTLSTYFGSLQYHKAGTVVAFIVIIVALMDFTSAKLRQQLV
jgi:phosphonate ABC transporter permease subunit PhnE